MFGIWLVPRNRLRPWVLFDIVYGLVILAAFLLLVDRIGVKATVIAYVLAHVSHAVLHYVLARRSIGFRLGPDNRILLLASLALLLLLLVVRPRTSPDGDRSDLDGRLGRARGPAARVAEPQGHGGPADPALRTGLGAPGRGMKPSA
jgi:hypothetical protein